jgi:hypothetical protein
MPKGDKYLELKELLEKSGQPIIKLSFKDVERIIQDRLPPSAYNIQRLGGQITKITHKLRRGLVQDMKRIASQIHIKKNRLFL